MVMKNRGVLWLKTEALKMNHAKNRGGLWLKTEVDC